MLSRCTRIAALVGVVASLLTSTHVALAQDQVVDDAPYFKRSREGWFWHQDLFQNKAVLPPAAASSPAPRSAVPTQQDRDLQAFEDFKRDFERAMNAATQNPIEANVVRFLEIYAQARAKASVLADTAQSLAVRMPWLDETFDGSRPTQPAAMAAFDTILMQDRDQLLREMSQSWGLYFFYRQNCAYCHVMAPQLKMFQQKYGFTVYAVTLDGGVLPQFPQSSRDAGMAQMVADALKIPSQHFVVPAVVLAKPASREVVAIGFGALNMDQMADRVAQEIRLRDQRAGQSSRTAVQALLGAVPNLTAVQRAQAGAPSAASSGAQRITLPGAPE